MVEIKEMSYKDKCSQLLVFLKREESYPAFVEQHLGSQALAEFQKECQNGTKPIAEDASDEEKYETALSNWAWVSGTKFTFIRNRMGEVGLDQFIKFEVEVLKKEIPGTLKFLLRLIRIISPGLAVKMTAKQVANIMRVVGPVSITELSGNRAVIDIPHCKLVDYPGGDDSCAGGCQGASSVFMTEQFGVDMKCNREGSHCTMAFTPFK